MRALRFIFLSLGVFLAANLRLLLGIYSSGRSEEGGSFSPREMLGVEPPLTIDVDNTRCLWVGNDWNSSSTPTTGEFPYPLTCKRSELYQFLERNQLIDCNTRELNADLKVAVAFHVGMVNNWEVILDDQITTLLQCGLTDITEKFMVSYSNGDKGDLLHFINDKSLIGSNTISIETVESTGAPWEGPAMNMIHEYCKRQPSPRSAVVFYFHNKGASKWRPQWKERLDRPWSYSRSLYWRKMLEYFLIERPSLCLGKILFEDAATCGANWQLGPSKHYSGNFWSASCAHIRKLHPLTSEDAGYNAAEFWLGQVEGNNINLFSEPNRSYYKELVLPEDYAFN